MKIAKSSTRRVLKNYKGYKIIRVNYRSGKTDYSAEKGGRYLLANSLPELKRKINNLEK